MLDEKKAVAKNGPDKFTLTADDTDQSYKVLVQAFGDGYVSKSFVFQPSQAGTLQTVCLDKAPPPPPPAPFGPPAITSYYVQAGVLTVEFARPQDVSDFNMRLEALDGPFALQPGGTRTFDGSDTKCIWENVLGGHHYRFMIQSVYKGLLKTNYSDWVAVEFDVSVDTGWVPPMQKVRAVSRNPNQLDVVAIAANQQAWARSWTAGSPWSAWQPIGGNFPAGNTVTLVSRNPNQLDLFTMGGNGHPSTSWWAPDGWSGVRGWADIGFLFPAGNTVTPVSRNPDQLDLFVVGNNGHVYTSWWTAGSTWSGLDGWRDIGFQFPPANTVTAVSRNPKQLDLFVVGNNGHVYTSWWYAGGDWSGINGWSDLGGAFPAGATVSAVSRNPSQLDLFVVHGDGTVWTTWWTAGANWVPWHPIAA